MILNLISYGWQFGWGVAGMGLCLGFVPKIVLITQGSFLLLDSIGTYSASCTALPADDWEGHRRLGGRQDIGRGNTAGTGDPD